MKKVVILSMQRVINYGSYLQAFALKSMIEKLGNEVEFVDIKKGFRYEFGNDDIDDIGYKKYRGIRKGIAIIDRYFFKRCIGQVYQKRLGKLFRKLQCEELGMSNTLQTDIPCDTLVIGSDEVFNCTTPSRWGVSYQLFGDYSDTDKVLTYAASCGSTKIEMLPENMKNKITDTFNKVSSISVRDKNTFSFTSTLYSGKVHEHLDPVLVADFSTVSKPYQFRYRYVLVYSYTNRINLSEEIREIKSFAKRHKLKTVSVGGYQCWCDYNLLVEPLELFNVFKGADYIVTDTFHGTVIASKMNCRYAVIIRSSNRNKLSDLIKRLDMERNIIHNIVDLEDVLTNDIDYHLFNDMIHLEQRKTIKYLKDNI